MTDVLKVACIQLSSGPTIEPNLTELEGFVREAAGRGAKFIVTPENSCHMRRPPEKKLESARFEKDHPAIPQFAALAKELGIWIELGSISIKLSDSKIANRCYVFNDKGDIAATYDKIHLFVVDLPGKETYRESNVVEAGNKAVVVQTPWGGLGLSICYDLRFAYLYRSLAQRGASIITVPAAFTVPTGKAHWEVLLRARAIETGSFVLAPGQTGEHDGGRKTWGHSMIIGPWGDILAQAGTEVGIIYADLNLGDVQKAREAIPALTHDRLFS